MPSLSIGSAWSRGPPPLPETGGAAPLRWEKVPRAPPEPADCAGCPPGRGASAAAGPAAGPDSQPQHLAPAQE